VVIALAGRRIDAANSLKPRFPLANVALVRARIHQLFEGQGACGLVSSGACGADLLALAEGGERGIQRRVVLPFPRDLFRETSVTDRPGDWGTLYDRVLDEVRAHGAIIVLDGVRDRAEAFAAANRTILDEAAVMAAEMRVAAVAALVWDGSPRGQDDLTKAFGDEARLRSLQVFEVMTL
jgi:hypothetical protein